ncbi:MAG: hypothetical protein IJI57_10570 [Flexilinea sp.]|nr:hypothetical protein [Flexilinea sp.]
MNVYSVSYNFPSGFLWGLAMPQGFALDRGNSPLLYQLRERSIRSLSVTLDWANFEPLKNNYEESLIESTRALLSRIRSQNMESIVIFNTAVIPQWQNLEHGRKKEFFVAEKFNFVTHLANAFVPYTGYVGLCCSESAYTSDREMKAEVEIQNDIRKYIRSLSESVKVGTVLLSPAFGKNSGRIGGLFQSFRRNPLQDSEADFFGISTDETAYNGIQNIFREERKPLMMLSDRLNFVSPQERTHTLVDRIYDLWQFYQKGWPIQGYFSDLNLSQDTETLGFFSEIVKANALGLSSDDPRLPEKWIRFLKE